MGKNHTPPHLRYMGEFCTYCVAVCPIRDLINTLGSYILVDLGNHNYRNLISSCMSADAYFNHPKLSVDAVSKTPVQPAEEHMGFRH